MADLGVLDVLVIGGGMGGCIVATRLAEHGVHPKTGKPLRIAILERGPTSRVIEIPVLDTESPFAAICSPVSPRTPGRTPAIPWPVVSPRMKWTGELDSDT